MRDDRSTPDETTEIRARLECVRAAVRDGTLTVFNDNHVARWVDIERLLSLLDAERTRSAEQAQEIARLKAPRVNIVRAKFAPSGEIEREWLESGEYAAIQRAEAAEQQLAQKDAELTTLRALTTWQPIETAPKDGTEVLLLEGRRIVNGSWNRGGAMHMPHWMGGNYEPTHWQPISQSPAVLPREDQR